MATTKRMANRYGLNLTLTGLGAAASENGKIDFANEVSLEINGEITWATGGQDHSNKVGFRDPLTGTLKISTQLVDGQILNLLTGGEVASTDAGTTSVSFKNGTPMKYYKIEGDTVWQDEDGAVYTEKITCWKASIKPGYSATYNGSGDPISLDIEFELSTDANGNFVDIAKAPQETM